MDDKGSNRQGPAESSSGSDSLQTGKQPLPLGQLGCYLSGLLDPSTRRTDAWSRSLKRARQVAKDNPKLARSVRCWTLLLAVVALCASSLTALVSAGTAPWLAVGVTLVWAVTLDRFFYLHMATMRSDEGMQRVSFGIPNILTTLRLLVVPTMAWFLANPLAPGRYSEAILWTLLGLGLTDTLDGVAARTLDQGTVFGKYVDPLTDIIVTTSAAMGVGLSGVVPWWLVGIVIFRYTGAFVGFTAILLRPGSFNFRPTWVGKLCTPAVQLLFFALTLEAIRPDLTYPPAVRSGLIGVTGAWVTFNVVYLTFTLFRLWNLTHDDATQNIGK